MEKSLKETNFTLNQVLGFRERLNDLEALERIHQMNTQKEIHEILKGCKNNTLTFTDDEDDDNLTGTNFMGEDAQICDVHIKGDAVELTTDDGDKLYPWELQIDFPTLHYYMVKELEREVADETEE